MENAKISKFISQVSGTGFSRANRYLLRISPPSQVNSSGATSLNPNDLLFRIASVNLPGKSLATTETKIYGPVRQAPYSTTYDQLTFSLYLSEGLYERDWFENWMHWIIDYDDHKLNYSSNYVGTITLEVYSEDGFMPQKYTFEECFPQAVGEVAFAYANEDLAQCPITIAYTKYMSGGNDTNAGRPNKGYTGVVSGIDIPQMVSGFNFSQLDAFGGLGPDFVSGAVQTAVNNVRNQAATQINQFISPINTAANQAQSFLGGLFA